MAIKTFKLEQLGIEVTLGKFAQQADGAVWIQQGGTVVLSTVVSAKSKEFPGFLPLTVDYRKYFSSGRQNTRAAILNVKSKFTDKEVLTAVIM